MKYLDLIARVLLGVIFLTFGMNKFFSFIPLPKVPVEAAEFLVALTRSGYFFPLLGTVEIVAGICVLSGRCLPLGIAILAAIIPHISFYLLLLAKTGAGAGMAVTLITLEFYLFIRNKKYFSMLIHKEGDHV